MPQHPPAPRLRRGPRLVSAPGSARHQHGPAGRPGRRGRCSRMPTTARTFDEAFRRGWWGRSTVDPPVVRETMRRAWVCPGSRPGTDPGPPIAARSAIVSVSRRRSVGRARPHPMIVVKVTVLSQHDRRILSRGQEPGHYVPPCRSHRPRSSRPSADPVRWSITVQMAAVDELACVTLEATRCRQSTICSNEDRLPRGPDPCQVGRATTTTRCPGTYCSDLLDRPVAADVHAADRGPRGRQSPWAVQAGCARPVRPGPQAPGARETAASQNVEEAVILTW